MLCGAHGSGKALVGPLTVEVDGGQGRGGQEQKERSGTG